MLRQSMHEGKTTSPICLRILAESEFNREEGYSVICTSKGRITFSSKDTPDFLKPVYETLNPLQAGFFLATKLKFNNVPFSAICSSPTSSGKTGIIMMYMKHFLDLYKDESSRPLIVYLSPLKALAREKSTEFQQVFGRNNVEIKTGDHTNTKVTGKKILVTTPDYLNLSIRNQVTFVKNIKAIVIDEVHTLFGSQNTMDEILWFVKEKRIHYLLLSATIPLLKHMIEFYKPDLYIHSEWQPIPLVKSYVVPREVKKDSGIDPKHCPFSDESCRLTCPLVNFDQIKKKLKANSNEYFRVVLLKSIVHAFASDNKTRKVIVFACSKAEGWNLLEMLNFVCGFGVLNEKDSAPFDPLEQRAGKPFSAFYCADLGIAEKVKLEAEFRKNEKFPLLISTSSLAYGVNFPADATIISTRYLLSKKSGIGVFIPDLIDCIQMAGRAGRLGLGSEKGDVYFVIKTSPERAKEASMHLEKMDTYPYEKVLKEKIGTTDMLANSILTAVKKGYSPRMLPALSFYIYCMGSSDRENNVWDEISSLTYNLIELDYIQLAKGGKRTLSRKGEFCYRSGINPFSLERLLIQLEDFKYKNWHSDPFSRNMSALATYILSGIQAESTIYSFINSVIDEKRSTGKEELLHALFEFLCSKSAELPSRNLANVIANTFAGSNTTKLNALIEGHYDLTRSQIADTATFLSFLLAASGAYFFFGLPKVYSDLSYIPLSSINYFIRNILSFESEFGLISPSFVLYTLHSFIYQLFDESLVLFLALKNYYKERLRFGYFKKSLLSLLVQECTRQALEKGCDFFYLKDVVKKTVHSLQENTHNLRQLTRKFVEKHISNRGLYFRKSVDRERLHAEAEDFLDKLENFIFACENGYLDSIQDHEILGTKVCSYILGNLGKSAKSSEEAKKQVHTYFLLKSLSSGKITV